MQADSPDLLALLKHHDILPRLELLPTDAPQQPGLPPVASSAAAGPAQPVTSGGDADDGSFAGSAQLAAGAAAGQPPFADVAAVLTKLFPRAALPGSGFGLPADGWQRLLAASGPGNAIGGDAAAVAACALADALPVPGIPAEGSAGGGGDGGSGQPAAAAEQRGRHPRPLAALETLVELAEESAARGRPLQWGWCR